MALVWSERGWVSPLGMPPGSTSPALPPALFPSEAIQVLSNPALAGTVPARVAVSGGRRRLLARILRYMALAGVATLVGYAGGFYLTVAGAAKLATLTSIATGLRVTRMVSADLERLGVESRILRLTLAGKIGVGFALLPWIGAGSGFTVWALGELDPFRRYIRHRIIQAGRRGLTGF